jgi:hypothetical protein
MARPKPSAIAIALAGAASLLLAVSAVQAQGSSLPRYGRHRTHYPNGKLRHESTYKNGKLHGRSREWHVDG